MNHKGNENTVKLIMPVLNLGKKGFLIHIEITLRINIKPESRKN